MALFKCIQTGNVTEFDLEWDIRTMRQHPEYEEVQEAIKPAAKSKKTVTPSEEV
jgi:hypothetical protein